MRECRRWSCELMKRAECRSPVQRVMATMSRDWFSRVRRVVRGLRRRGCVVLRVRLRGGWVRRRRASVYCFYVSHCSACQELVIGENKRKEIEEWRKKWREEETNIHP
jgi:hypothetical protein